VWGRQPVLAAQPYEVDLAQSLRASGDVRYCMLKKLSVPDPGLILKCLQ
jgi:hypothetical protein